MELFVSPTKNYKTQKVLKIGSIRKFCTFYSSSATKQHQSVKIKLRILIAPIVDTNFCFTNWNTWRLTDEFNHEVFEGKRDLRFGCVFFYFTNQIYCFKLCVKGPFSFVILNYKRKLQNNVILCWSFENVYLTYIFIYRPVIIFWWNIFFIRLLLFVSSVHQHHHYHPAIVLRWLAISILVTLQVRKKNRRSKCRFWGVTQHTPGTMLIGSTESHAKPVSLQTC